MEAAQQALVEGLRGAVERVVRVGVVGLVRGERLGEAVDRCRGCGHDPAHALPQGGLDHVVGPVDHHFEGESRFLRALRDPHRRLVEDDIDPTRQLGDELAVADVALDQPDGPVGERPGEVLAPSAHEVVEHDDLSRAGLHELIGDVRADRARSAGDQRALIAHGHGTHDQSTIRGGGIFHVGGKLITGPSPPMWPPGGARRSLYAGQ